jgi:hypothetical protein
MHPVPAQHVVGAYTEPDSGAYAMAGREFIVLNLNGPLFKRAYLADGKLGVDCALGTCDGYDRENTGEVKFCTIATGSGARKFFLAHYTSLCSQGGHILQPSSTVPMLPLVLMPSTWLNSANE